jgi:hypothetical protein
MTTTIIITTKITGTIMGKLPAPLSQKRNPNPPRTKGMGNNSRKYFQKKQENIYELSGGGENPPPALFLMKVQ